MWKEEAESRFQRLSEKLKDLAQARTPRENESKLGTS